MAVNINLFDRVGLQKRGKAWMFSGLGGARQPSCGWNGTFTGSLTFVWLTKLNSMEKGIQTEKEKQMEKENQMEKKTRGLNAVVLLRHSLAGEHGLCLVLSRIALKPSNVGKTIWQLLCSPFGLFR